LSASAVVIDETVDHGVVSSEENKILQISATHWDEQFEELLSFKAEYGHCNFPQNTTEELTKKYPALARFCHDQRLEYQRLYDASSYRKKNDVMLGLQWFDRTVRWRQLKEIGFAFSMKIAQWYDKYHELLQYRDNNGHVRVTEKENRLLCSWIFNQRRRRKGTARSRLSNTEMQLLDDIGFEWESVLSDVKWMEKYNELLDFKNKHGHLLVAYKAG